jgi:hypothetical protein
MAKSASNEATHYEMFFTILGSLAYVLLIPEPDIGHHLGSLSSTHLSYNLAHQSLFKIDPFSASLGEFSGCR